MIHHATKTVGTTPTLLTTIPAGSPYTAVLIYNADNSAIFVGDVSVAVSGVDQGITIPKSTNSTQLWLNATDSLYAISVTGTSANAVTVLYSSDF